VVGKKLRLNKITIPELSLVVLVGPSGCGKSTFARNHFKPTEVLSSDFCRALVSDDENNQAATKDAFEILHFIAAKRLAAGRLTVVDATNVQPEARKPLVALAREYHVIPVAIVLNLQDRFCQDRNRERPDRNFGPHVIRQQSQQLRRSLRNLKREGFRHIHEFSKPEEVEAVVALYGETTGETDEFGLPVRYNWAAEYRGRAMVVYGHTPVPEPEWLNGTICVDTGCVFGGKLTALRYPEKELVSVPALQTYYESAKPFLPVEDQAPALTAQQQYDDVLDIDDISGKRIISTRLHRTVTIREENSIAALEVMKEWWLSLSISSRAVRVDWYNLQ
jgi:predicted kinase